MIVNKYNEYGKQVIGKKGTTIIFYPYMIHKGNYTKLGYTQVYFMCSKPICDCQKALNLIYRENFKVFPG